MSTVKKEVEVSKESSEVADAVSALVKSIKEAGADGFQAAQDIPTVVLGNLQSLSTALEGSDKIGDEYKENPQAFLSAWMLGGSEVAGCFLKKDEGEAPAE
jgi:hypothetical protein